MKFPVSAALIAATAAWSSPATAGWLGLDWGASLEEVAEHPDIRLLKERQVKRDDEGLISGRGAVGTHMWHDRKFRGIYYFEDGGLVAVGLENRSDCGNLLTELIADYGEPGRQWTGIPRSATWWHQPTGNKIDYRAGSDCTVWVRELDG